MIGLLYTYSTKAMLGSLLMPLDSRHSPYEIFERSRLRKSKLGTSGDIWIYGIILLQLAERLWLYRFDDWDQPPDMAFYYIYIPKSIAEVSKADRCPRFLGPLLMGSLCCDSSARLTEAAILDLLDVQIHQVQPSTPSSTGYVSDSLNHRKPQEQKKHSKARKHSPPSRASSFELSHAKRSRQKSPKYRVAGPTKTATAPELRLLFGEIASGPLTTALELVDNRTHEDEGNDSADKTATSDDSADEGNSNDGMPGFGGYGDTVHERTSSMPRTASSRSFSSDDLRTLDQASQPATELPFPCKSASSGLAVPLAKIADERLEITRRITRSLWKGDACELQDSID